MHGAELPAYMPKARHARAFAYSGHAGRRFFPAALGRDPRGGRCAGVGAAGLTGM